MSLEDIKFKCNTFFSNNGPFYGLNNSSTRIALINYFGSSHTAKDAVDILIYLIAQTYSENEKNLEDHDGYIIRTNEQIELFTGCRGIRKKKGDNNPIEVLINRDLIERDNSAAYGSSRYRVNVDNIWEEIERATADFSIRKEQFDLKMEKKKENVKKIREKVSSKEWSNVDWYNIEEDVNKSSQEGEEGEEIYRKLLNQGLTPYDLQVVYYVGKYWRETFGEKYTFNEPELIKLRGFLTHGGTQDIRNNRGVDRLERSIKTINELGNLNRAWNSTKIHLRWQGISFTDFKK